MTNITTSINEVSLNNTAPTFGQLVGYGTYIEVPVGSPNPTGGTVLFLNGTQTLATASVAGPNVTYIGNITVRIPGPCNMLDSATGNWLHHAAGDRAAKQGMLPLFYAAQCDVHCKHHSACPFAACCIILSTPSLTAGLNASSMHALLESVTPQLALHMAFSKTAVLLRTPHGATYEEPSASH